MGLLYWEEFAHLANEKRSIIALLIPLSVKHHDSFDEPKKISMGSPFPALLTLVCHIFPPTFLLLSLFLPIFVTFLPLFQFRDYRSDWLISSSISTTISFPWTEFTKVSDCVSYVRPDDHHDPRGHDLSRPIALARPTSSRHWASAGTDTFSWASRAGQAPDGDSLTPCAAAR